MGKEKGKGKSDKKGKDSKGKSKKKSPVKKWFSLKKQKEMSETESDRGKNIYWSWLADISFHCG